ncbi:MAG: hypothetical protein WDO73_10990 [Ignavibacteriota bacterium]
MSGRLPYIEVLLRLGTLQGVAKTPEIPQVRSGRVRRQCGGARVGVNLMKLDQGAAA